MKIISCTFLLIAFTVCQIFPQNSIPNSLIAPDTLTAEQDHARLIKLLAMCAPRPVFISCGSPEVEGTWVDDKVQFMAAVAAESVYKLPGKVDLGTTEMPLMGTALINGDIAFRQHFGGYTTLDN